MADYNSMKVPELKKLLTERSLPHTGNKADLIARLTENDKQKAPEPQAGKQTLLLDSHCSIPFALARDCICYSRPPIHPTASSDAPTPWKLRMTRCEFRALHFMLGNRHRRLQSN
jgi:hypothetical protein